MNKYRIFEITEKQLETLEMMHTYKARSILIRRQQKIVEELFGDCLNSMKDVTISDLDEYDVPLLQAKLKGFSKVAKREAYENLYR